jgi:hypothetical protein
MLSLMMRTASAGYIEADLATKVRAPAKFLTGGPNSAAIQSGRYKS